jgi:thioredoxin reductase (NADPH)
MKNVYDVMIIGGGPAGLTAGIYCSRARLKTVLLEKMMCGGQILITDKIENFPAFPDGVKGPELAESMTSQAKHFGLEIETGEAAAIDFEEGAKKPFKIKTASGKEIEALSVIISTGARWNALSIPGEKELTGRGVSYCATCDGPLCRNKDVVVVGGGDSAIEDALFLTKFAASVTRIHRRERLRATKILQERAFADKKIKFCFNSVAVEVIGKSKVEGLKIKDVNTSKEDVIKCDAIFVLIGMTPNKEFVKDILKTDEKGYVVCADNMKTSVDGIFAAGDVRKKLLRQVVTATGDGATAAFSAQHYVDHLKGTEYI